MIRYRPLWQRQQPYLLAHMNFARLKAPLDHPSLSEFRLAMEPVNLIAKSSPGFVWSFDNDGTLDGAAARQEVPLLRDDPLMMPQLSLWKDIESLQHFAFKSGHFMYLKRRREWFTAPEEAPWAVCWWRRTTDDHPSLKEAFERCQYLKEHGVTEHAFDYKSAKNFPMERGEPPKTGGESDRRSPHPQATTPFGSLRNP